MGKALSGSCPVSVTGLVALRKLSLCNQPLVQFSTDHFEPCIPVVNILKMCMWLFNGARFNFDRITAF